MSPKDVASLATAEQQTHCNNCVVDDTNGTDCWHYSTGGGQLVTAGVSRRSSQNSNWMWWAYHSSDSSRQCHSVANSTADRLSGLHQLYHQQHTLHELWARCLSKIHSTVDLYSTMSDLKSVEKSCHRLNTAAFTWLLVIWQQTGENTAGKLGRRQCSRLCHAMQLLCAVYAYTGTNSDCYEYICKYVNQRSHWTFSALEVF